MAGLPDSGLGSELDQNRSVALEKDLVLQLQLPAKNWLSQVALAGRWAPTSSPFSPFSVLWPRIMGDFQQRASPQRHGQLIEMAPAGPALSQPTASWAQFSIQQLAQLAVGCKLKLPLGFAK
jgi:hypothetical protein